MDKNLLIPANPTTTVGAITQPVSESPTSGNSVAHSNPVDYGGRSLFRCIQCKKVFGRRSNLVNHMRKQHKKADFKVSEANMFVEYKPPAPLFTKEIAREKRPLELLLNRESLKDTSVSIQCSECFKVFKSTRHIVSHMGMAHNLRPNQINLVTKNNVIHAQVKTGIGERPKSNPPHVPATVMQVKNGCLIKSYTLHLPVVNSLSSKNLKSSPSSKFMLVSIPKTTPDLMKRGEAALPNTSAPKEVISIASPDTPNSVPVLSSQDNGTRTSLSGVQRSPDFIDLTLSSEEDANFPVEEIKGKKSCATGSNVSVKCEPSSLQIIAPVHSMGMKSSPHALTLKEFINGKKPNPQNVTPVPMVPVKTESLTEYLNSKEQNPQNVTPVPMMPAKPESLTDNLSCETPNPQNVEPIPMMPAKTEPNHSASPLPEGHGKNETKTENWFPLQKLDIDRSNIHGQESGILNQNPPHPNNVVPIHMLNDSHSILGKSVDQEHQPTFLPSKNIARNVPICIQPLTFAADDTQPPHPRNTVPLEMRLYDDKTFLKSETPNFETQKEIMFGVQKCDLFEIPSTLVVAPKEDLCRCPGVDSNHRDDVKPNEEELTDQKHMTFLRTPSWSSVGECSGVSVPRQDIPCAPDSVPARIVTREDLNSEYQHEDSIMEHSLRPLGYDSSQNTKSDMVQKTVDSVFNLLADGDCVSDIDDERQNSNFEETYEASVNLNKDDSSHFVDSKYGVENELETKKESVRENMTDSHGKSHPESQERTAPKNPLETGEALLASILQESDTPKRKLHENEEANRKSKTPMTDNNVTAASGKPKRKYKKNCKNRPLVRRLWMREPSTKKEPVKQKEPPVPPKVPCKIKCRKCKQIKEHQMFHTEVIDAYIYYTCDECKAHSPTVQDPEEKGEEAKGTDDSDKEKDMPLSVGQKIEYHNSYRCYVCDEVAFHKPALYIHIFEDHKIDSCQFCPNGTNYKAPWTLYHHVMDHVESFRYIEERFFHCIFCGLALKSKALRKKHELAAHDIREGGKFKCYLCPLSLRGLKTVKKHRAAHENGMAVECKKCGKVCNSPKQLAKHKNTVHKGRNHLCHICGFSCRISANLEIHMLVHTKEKPFKCDVCGTSFSRKANMETHMRKHTGEKPYVCDYCGKGFSRSDNFNNHLKKVHGETKEA